MTLLHGAHRVPTIYVGPHPYRVLYVDEAMRAAGANGQCMTDTTTIWLDSACSDSRQRETSLHEVLHAIWGDSSFLGYKYPDADADSKGELIIGELAPRLLEVLRNNPDWLEYLTEEDE